VVFSPSFLFLDGCGLGVGEDFSFQGAVKWRQRWSLDLFSPFFTEYQQALSTLFLFLFPYGILGKRGFFLETRISFFLFLQRVDMDDYPSLFPFSEILFVSIADFSPPG